jgi:Biopolymer transport protein
MKRNRKAPQINSTSTADIAFMMLLFFLLTTSMDTDQGLARTLPRPPDPLQQKPEEAQVNKRNLFNVRINGEDQILCNGDEVDLKTLKERAKEFIENPNDLDNLPEKVTEYIPLLGGNVLITKYHLISLQCYITTSYQKYIDVQNELAAAYNELRDTKSGEAFGKKFKDLSDEEQEALKTFYPQKISEAEPKNYGNK